MKRSLLFIVLLSCISLCVNGQNEVRPFNKWESIAFCSYNQYHPFDYIRTDNNWELLFTLRTPHTASELKSMGIKFNESQLKYLMIGGLVKMDGKHLYTTFPIYDEEQTIKIRNLSRKIAEETFKETESDYRDFTKVLAKQGYKENAYSLLFSYLLDSKTWHSAVPSKNKISHNLTWDGLMYITFEPRKSLKTGTNGYGFLKVTWSDSLAIWPKTEDINRFVKQFTEHGKITEPELIKDMSVFDIVDKDGNITIPIISLKGDNEINKLSSIITDKNIKGLNKGLQDFKQLANISDDNVAKVILFHEMMWDTMDLLKEKKIISMPLILQSSKVKEKDFRKISYMLTP